MAYLRQEVEARAEIAQPSSPFSAREQAERLGLKPQKTRGQNFVVDPNTIERIVRLADVSAEDVVLEIGPGLGALTSALVDRARAVLAVEIDSRLALLVSDTVVVKPGHRLVVVNRDAMQMASEEFQIDGSSPNILVANLPYNVATPLVLTLLEKLDSLTRATVMVQSEVAQRWCAVPGSKIYGVPSVKLAWFGETKTVGSVDRTIFWPQPHVDSALVQIVRKPAPTSQVSRERVFKVIDAAFSQRRKTLVNALTSRGYPRQHVVQAVSNMGLNEKVRGETLDCARFIELTTQLSALDAPRR